VQKKILIALLVATLCIGTASAQFGGVVYDPTNYHNALLRYYQLQQHLAQLRRTYALIYTRVSVAVSTLNLRNKVIRRYP
jgi:tRNA uridine 5-carbamoylmethylation protein Kti12